MKKWKTLLLILVFLAGLSLLLYPPISNYLNSMRQSRLVSDYMENVSELESARKLEILEEAYAYNRELAAQPFHLNLSEEEMGRYENTLNVSRSGIMGYLEIPKIDVALPIYHGTEKEVLEIAVGHLSGTSLPVGGPSTHAVLTGHTGLPSARLLTDLRELVEGDVFYIQVLNETLTYEVDQIRKVLPEVTKDLEIVPGEDYCTLVTCTPYGVNTHRLLIRGHRVETEKSVTMRFSANALQIDPLVVMPFLYVPILLILFLLVMIKPNRSKKIEKQLKELQENP